MEANEASLNITLNGQNGNLKDPVFYDSSDADIKEWGTEAVRTGGVAGIDADPNADFSDFVVDRFDAKDGEDNRLYLRPKVPFGS